MPHRRSRRHLKNTSYQQGAGRPHPARLEEEKDIQYVLAQLRVLMIALSSSSGQCRTCPNKHQTQLHYPTYSRSSMCLLAVVPLENL
jgi:hypothetical protein